VKVALRNGSTSQRYLRKNALSVYGNKQGDDLHSAEMIVAVTFKPAWPLKVYSRANDRHAVSWKHNAIVLTTALMTSTTRVVSEGTI